jgi:hypothetical protein
MNTWTGHVACMGKKWNSYRILVWKTERQRPFGRSWHTWKGNAKMDHTRRMGERVLVRFISQRIGEVRRWWSDCMKECAPLRSVMCSVYVNMNDNSRKHINFSRFFSDYLKHTHSRVRAKMIAIFSRQTWRF